jgi:hypothetical protein
MTVLTLSAQPGQDAMPAPVPWQRMIWVTWRQHRALLIGLTSVLAAAAVFMLIAGLDAHRAYTALISCRPVNSNACAALNSHFNNIYWPMGNTVDIFMSLAPVLIGMFTGPAVLARELETGTFRYAWTQGIGRVRWTIAKLTLLAVAITILAWAFSQLFGWFFDPVMDFEGMSIVGSKAGFDTHGIDFAAWTLVAFAIGAFLGMFIRKIIPAMAATLGVYVALDLLSWLVLREDYPVAIDTTNASLFNGPSTPNSPWILKTWTVGHTNWWRYIPASRFWPMQFIESGWLLVLAIALMAATVWLVRHRAA